MAKPSPVSRLTVCSVCGLDWDRHTKDRKTAPTADVCIRLLKAELAKRPSYAQNPLFSGGSTGMSFGNVTPINAAMPRRRRG